MGVVGYLYVALSGSDTFPFRYFQVPFCVRCQDVFVDVFDVF